MNFFRVIQLKGVGAAPHEKIKAAFWSPSNLRM